ILFQAESGPHGWQRSISIRTGLMSGGINIGPARLIGRYSQSVANLSLKHHLLIANETRKNRQTCGIGRGKVIGTLLVGFQIKNGPGIGPPSTTIYRESAVEFVE